MVGYSACAALISFCLWLSEVAVHMEIGSMEFPYGVKVQEVVLLDVCTRSLLPTPSRSHVVKCENRPCGASDNQRDDHQPPSSFSRFEDSRRAFSTSTGRISQRHVMWITDH